MDGSTDTELSEEFDTGVAEDEIVAGGGHYNVGTVPGTTWKALLIIGVLLALFGIVLELMVMGWIYPIPDYLPTPLGSGLALGAFFPGLVIVLAGFLVRSHDQREPPIEPIV